MQPTKLSGQPILCQLLSFVPRGIVDRAAETFQSDRYYKTMDTWKQLVFMLYGVVSKAQSPNSLCKCLLFLGQKPGYLGISRLPASSTLSDANRRRPNEVFGYIYYLLLAHYRAEISDSYPSLSINGEASPDRVKLFGSTTLTLFTDVFKGAGRNPLDGRKKGGLKAHAVLPLDNMVPELVWLTPRQGFPRTAEAAKRGDLRLRQGLRQLRHLQKMEPKRGLFRHPAERQCQVRGGRGNPRPCP